MFAPQRYFIYNLDIKKGRINLWQKKENLIQTILVYQESLA